MRAIVHALFWAAAMLLIAIGKAYGLVEPRTAQTMFAILPALAVVNISRRGACLFRRAEAPR